MFDFSKYKTQQDKISSILEKLNGSTFFTSQAKTLMQLFVLNVEIPDGLKIDFSSIEEFSFPNNDNKTTESTLSNLLLILPYEYWKKTINPSIFYNKKVLKDALFISASKNNLEFIKESYIQLINLSKNISFDDDKYQTIYDNPLSVPFPVNKTYVYNAHDSYLETFNKSCSELAEIWNEIFPLFLTNKNLSWEEENDKIKTVISLEKFSLVYFYKLMGNCPSPILSSHNKNNDIDFFNTHLTSMSKFTRVSDIDKWCIENENLDPKSYIQNNYISLEDKYNDISFSFFLRNKLSNINKYFHSYYDDNNTFNNYSSAYNKKNGTNLKDVFKIDHSLYDERFSNIDTQSFDIFMKETLNGYIKSSGKKKLSLDITKNINASVIIACSLFNSDYLDEYISNQIITKSNAKDRFFSMVQSTLSYDIPNDRFSSPDLKLIKCLAIKNLYSSFKKHYKSIEDVASLKIFDPDFSSEDYDPSTFEKELSLDNTVTLLNCLNHVLKIVSFTETSSSAKTPVSFKYFIAKKIVQSSEKQNLKFLKVVDYTDSILNDAKKIKSLNSVKLESQIFHELNEDVKEHVFMEICQIEKRSNIKSKLLKF